MTTATNEMLQGVKRIILWRYLKDAETKPGSKIALQTEHEASSSRDINAVPTKDGTKRSLGQVEQEVEVTSYLADSDEVDRMKEAHEMGEKIEVWDVTNEHPDENGKYKATYYQGFIGEISEKAPNDDGIEVTTTISVDGIGKRGRTILSDDQAEILDYLFVEASAGTTQEAARASLASSSSSESTSTSTSESVSASESTSTSTSV